MKTTLASQQRRRSRTRTSNREAAIKTLGDRIDSHSHTPAANGVRMLDIEANPKDSEFYCWLRERIKHAFKWSILRTLLESRLKCEKYVLETREEE